MVYLHRCMKHVSDVQHAGRQAGCEAGGERKEAHSAVVSGWVGRPNRCYKQSSASTSFKATRRAKPTPRRDWQHPKKHLIRSASVPQCPRRVSKQELALAHLTVQILPVADVLEVAARLLPAQLGLGPVGLEPGVRVSPVLGARRHAAGGRVPHGASRLWWPSDPDSSASAARSPQSC